MSLKKVSLQTSDGSGPGALEIPLGSAVQLQAGFRWSASNDSEAFGDAVLSMASVDMHGKQGYSLLLFCGSNFEMMPWPPEDPFVWFETHRKFRLQHSGARGALDFFPRGQPYLACWFVG